MKARCYYQKEIGYHKYGGRGIKVCDRWRNSFKAFLEDMGPKPSEAHQLDRIDSKGDYCPENCRWATPTQNNRNRCSVRFLEWNGERLPLIELAERYNLSRTTLSSRIDAGWPIAAALTTPPTLTRSRPNFLAHDLAGLLSRMCRITEANYPELMPTEVRLWWLNAKALATPGREGE